MGDCRPVLPVSDDEPSEGVSSDRRDGVGASESLYDGLEGTAGTSEAVLDFLEARSELLDLMRASSDGRLGVSDAGASAVAAGRCV